MNTRGSIPARLRALEAWRTAWLAIAGIVLLALISNPAFAAKPFRGGQFDYYVTDYLADLARLAKTIGKSNTDLEAEVAAAEAGGNARQTAVAIERLLSKSPADQAAW